MKKLMMVLVIGFTSAASANTLASKLIQIRGRYPAVTAAQITSIVKTYSRLEIRKTYQITEPDNVVHSGTSSGYNEFNQGTYDQSQGTHDAGVINELGMADGAESTPSELEALMAAVPGVSQAEMTGILKILNK